MYGKVLDLVLKAFKSRLGIFGYIDGNGDWVAPSLTRKVWDICKMKKKDIKFDMKLMSKTVFSKAIKTRKCYILKTPLRSPPGHLVIKEALVAPLTFGGKVTGMISIANPHKGSYSKASLTELEDIARHIAPTLYARRENEKQSEKNHYISQELLKLQKIKSLGLLAAGMAHDFNNMLSGIMGNLSLLEMEIPCENNTGRELLKEAIGALQTSKTALRRFFTLPDGEKLVKTRLAPAGVIRSAARLATRGSNCVCKFSFAAVLPEIMADKTRLFQMLFNLVTNSVQATPAGGLITVSAKSCRLTSDSPIPLPPGRYLKITIEDRGHGIAAEMLPRIFDQSFSTHGLGRGLGLTLAYLTVKTHGGHIIAASEPGRGAVFTVYLPSGGRL